MTFKYYETSVKCPRCLVQNIDMVSKKTDEEDELFYRCPDAACDWFGYDPSGYKQTKGDK